MTCSTYEESDAHRLHRRRHRVTSDLADQTHQSSRTPAHKIVRLFEKKLNKQIELYSEFNDEDKVLADVAPMTLQ